MVKEIIFNQPDRTIATVIAALRRHAEIVQPDAPSHPTGGAGGSTITRGLFTGKNQSRRFKRFGSTQGTRKFGSEKRIYAGIAQNLDIVRGIAF